MARTRLYRDGVLKSEGFPVADVSDHLEDPANVVWVDVCEPDEADLAAIAEELQLHRLGEGDGGPPPRGPRGGGGAPAGGGGPEPPTPGPEGPPPPPPPFRGRVPGGA